VKEGNALGVVVRTGVEEARWSDPRVVAKVWRGMYGQVL